MSHFHFIYTEWVNSELFQGILYSEVDLDNTSTKTNGATLLVHV